jgi:hypothetical protein
MDPPLSRGKKISLVVLGVAFLLINIDGIVRRFRRQVHVRVPSVPQLPYPQCGDVALDTANLWRGGELLVSTISEALPTGADRGTWERFELRARACHRVVTVHREGPQSVIDCEVVLDESMRPIRAWRRIGRPGRQGIQYDTRTYEFRTPFVTITRVDEHGHRTYEELRSKEKPTVVIAPGSAALTTWIQSARLQEGMSAVAWVLDLRQPLERAWRSTLRRERDMDVEGLGRVRVYALDEESFFTDANDRVVGTLSGMRELPRGAPLPVEIDSQSAPEPWRTDGRIAIEQPRAHSR